MWAAVCENGDFLHLRELLKIDGYMLRGVWQAIVSPSMEHIA